MAFIVLNAAAANLDEGAANGVKLDADGFEVSDSNNIMKKTNPKLRPEETIQKSELVNYEAAGQLLESYDNSKVVQGWLVGECLVVAPRHAVIADGNLNKTNSNVHSVFKVGYQGKNNFKYTVTISPIFCGTANAAEGKPGEDFCIFKTNRLLKDKVIPIIIKSINYEMDKQISVTAVGFFPQKSVDLDELAKDSNAIIVSGTSSYLDARTANISGAGLVLENPQSGKMNLIGLQVGPFYSVNSKKMWAEIREFDSKHKGAFSCN